MAEQETKIQDYIGALIKQRNDNANESSILIAENIALKREIRKLQATISRITVQIDPAVED